MSAEQHHHGPLFYVKIWAILLGLLIISVVGPEFGIMWLTLVTAFGIAIVKAIMVAKHFMHLNTERRFVSYMLLAMVIFSFLFFAGVAADVMKTSGERWHNVAAEKHIEDNQHMLDDFHKHQHEEH